MNDTNNKKMKECDSCEKSFVPKNFYIHKRKCSLKTQNISENTSEVERMEEVLKHGVKDDIYDVMSKDSLILNFGKELCILDTWHRKRCNEIRTEMRRLARILVTCRELDGNITD